MLSVNTQLASTLVPMASTLIPMPEDGLDAINEGAIAQAWIIRERVIRVAQEIASRPPENMAQMGYYCHNLDDRLQSACDIVAMKRNKNGKSLLSRLNKVRKRMRKAIIHAQRREKKWEQMEWGSREKNIDNVKKVVTAHLGLSKTPPPVGTPEWNEERGKILSIKSAHFQEWNLIASCNNKNKFFSSHIDVLMAVFDDSYDIKDELQMRYNSGKHKWGTRQITIANVKERVSEELDLPGTPSPVGTPEWNEERGKILSIKFAQFREWNLIGSCNYNNEFFSSYIDVLIASFGNYNLKRWMFQSLGRFVFGSASEETNNLITEEDTFIVKDVLRGYPLAMEKLQKKCFQIHVCGCEHLDLDEQKNMAFVRLVNNIQIMGLDCPIALSILWRAANKCCRISSYFKSLKFRFTEDRGMDYIVTSRSQEDFSTGNVGEDTHDKKTAKLDIQKLSHHLTQRERIIINQYTEGEIDITDERVQSIIYKLQKMVVN